MTVVVEHREGATAEATAEAGQLLVRLVKNSIGVTVGVQVVAPDTVERSLGKMRRIVDQRPPR
jgi:phenylacetate-CoA ligase